MAAHALDVVDTEGLLASQWYLPADQSTGYGPGSGPRRLMVAVLVDALRCAIEAPKNGRQRSQQLADLRWIASESRARLFSFVRICQVLDLDHVALRRGLQAVNLSELPTSRGRVGKSTKPALEPRHLRRIYAGHRPHGPLT